MKEEQTAGLRFISIIWDENKTSAWEALNHALHEALLIAIGAKLEFKASDLQFINETMRTGYWLGERGWEPIYAYAITSGSMEFVKVFEDWKGRKPFIANDVSGQGSAYTHGGYSRQRGRIALDFTIGNWRTKVTSITNDYVIICDYEGDNRVPKHRHKLTHEQLAERYPAPKKVKKATEKELESV